MSRKMTKSDLSRADISLLINSEGKRQIRRPS